MVVAAAWFVPDVELAAVLHASGITDDEWLDRATDWCWRSIETTEQPGGYWLKNACRFLDTVPDEQRARAAIASLATRVHLSALAGEGADGRGVACTRPFASSR